MITEPIAIIGTSCVLPGALSPAELWTAVVRKQDCLSLREFSALSEARRCGSVSGFDRVFNPDSYGLPAQELLRLDPMIQWLLHGAGEAFASGQVRIQEVAQRTGAIFGNLSYPTRGLSEHVLSVQSHSQHGPDPRNRFMSGGPAQFLARTFGLQAGVLALDAACASSLYAIKHACDHLQDGRADLMLAGGVNAAEPGFIQKGFEALQALSPTGRSRPFHREADGLVPAEGAAFVLLKRLDDAIRDGNPIQGVIRGVGLSNDGRGSGFLSPSSAGQIEAMRAAYRSAGIDPASIQLLECHATGTKVGDAVEIESLRHVFSEARASLPIGSLKSNLGHLITAAGAAGVIKVLEAMKAGILPPSLHAEEPLDALRGSPFHVQDRAEPWVAQGLKRAGVSGFGFGGVNAHLVLEEWKPTPRLKSPGKVTQPRSGQLAIVAVETRVAGGQDQRGFLQALASGRSLLKKREDGSLAGVIDEIAFGPRDLKFPPKDLAATLPQQLLMMQACQGAVGQVSKLSSASTGVYVGMQCDAEAVRKGLLPRGELTAADVIGCMPNIVANRINSQFDFRGPSHAVSAEERSGVEALALARRALEHGEIDAAVVGAVDICCEPAHEAAARKVLRSDQQIPGDAAVVLILKRLEDARRDGDSIYALLEEGDSSTLALSLVPFIGHAHAAAGLLEIAVGALCCRHGVRPVEGSSALQPWFVKEQDRRLNVQGVGLASCGTEALALTDVPRIELLTQKEMPKLGKARLAIVANDTQDLETKKSRAIAWLDQHPTPKAALTEIDDGIYFAPRELEGEVSLVFTGAAAAYPGMGRELALAFPQYFERLAGRMEAMREAAGWIYDKPLATRKSMGPSEKLWATSLLSQLHAELCLDVLGLKAQAGIGLSSGETNALFAFGAWRDMEAMYREIDASGIYGRELSGEFRAAQRMWKAPSVDWTCFSVRVPAQAAREALAGEKRVYLMIIDSPNEVLIGGERADCERVLAKLGRDKAALSSFSLAVHCPVVEEFAASWRKIHTRETHPVPGVRFYTHADVSSYEATREAAAGALLGQALHTVDFPALISKAWDDGVRLFVETGPGDFCSGWIRETLGEREHVALSLDRPARGALTQFCHTAAALACVGAKTDLRKLQEKLTGMREVGNVLSSELKFPVHAARDGLRMQSMPAAPRLPIQDVSTGAQEDLFGPLLSVQRQMAETHQQFIADQHRMHESFLRLPFGRPDEMSSTAQTLPSFSREQLEVLASGKISAVLGPMFSVQDDFRRQVRMPEPPLLLADRITGIDAVPGSMETGRLWSETDVRWDSWYLNAGYMPAGIMIEAGQADLLLISWLGADFLNQGERVYRLLGCDLTYYGGLPRPGDTLTYEIHIDGHADHQGMRIFFFHSECRINGELRQTVRNGQAGFFSDEELARSAGILWTPEIEVIGETRVDEAAVVCQKTAFGAEDLRAFSDSHVYECFGPGFERAQTHICTPKLQEGQMLLLDEIPRIEIGGGPWRKGYLRAVKRIAPDTWFFDGHFKDDPCMPGTLMFEGCLQAMSFYLSYLGYSLDKDGWRFEPELERQYDLRCRGQVTPSSRELIYEVFVRELHSGPEPRIVADVLCTVDGLKAFHARELSLRLKRDWPLSARPQPLLLEERPVAVVDGFEFGEHAILANGLGSPAQAFGELYKDFETDRGYGFPRLPAPPFLFLTRLAHVEGAPNQSGPGLVVEFEYDIRPEDWYFAEKGTPTLPLCAMVEIALQPCVWISAYMGIPKSVDHPVQCRNLGGTATWYNELPPGTGTLTVRSTVTGNSLFGGTEIQNCDIECFAGEQKVFEAKSVSGNFSRESLQNQAGLSVTPEEIKKAYEPNSFRQELAGYGRGELVLPDGMLLMAERITGLWEQGGRAGLGRIRAEKDIRPDAWYFKAHFPNDPVQPGSLGLEAIVQVLKFYLLHHKLDEGIADPHFEPIALEREFSWKYRGQILHTNRLMMVEAEITKVVRDDSGVSVFADAWIWIDGKRIYEARSSGMRVASGA